MNHRIRVLGTVAAGVLVVSGMLIPVLGIDATTASATGAVSPGEILTIAGDGSIGTSGNAGLATAANLDDPGSAIVDSSGNLYIADTANNRVQFVAADTCSATCPWGLASTVSGDVYTIAGSSSGTSGHSGDGGLATSALLDSPIGLALDSSGDLFVADSGNNRIQEVSATTHTQFGISMTADHVYTVAGSASGTGGSSGDSGPAASALLSAPSGVTVDPSNDLLIADSGNNRLQFVLANSCSSSCQWGISSTTADDIYTIAGSASGTAGSSGDSGAAASALLRDPSSVSLDGGGNLYVSDSGNNRVQFVAASSCSTSCPWGLASSTADDVYTIAGSASGTAGSTGDGGVATSALLDDPSGIAVDSSGDLYIADTGNDRLQELAAAAGSQWGQAMSAGDVYTITGSAGKAGFAGDGGLASGALVDAPLGVAIDPTGNIDLVDSGNERVRQIAPTTSHLLSSSIGDITTFAGNGTSGHAGDGAQATDAEFDSPNDVAVDAAGNVYVSDSLNNRIQEIAATNHTQWGITMTAGDVYTILGSSTGSSGSSGDGGVATSALLDHPSGVAVDSSGNLNAADSGNNRIQFVATASCSSSCAWGLASTTAGDVYTIAGSSSGSSGDSGDAGAATSALLDDPVGLVLDSHGDLDVADSGNNRVQEVADSTGTQWGISMTADDVYTIAGSSTGVLGSSGDGGAATSAKLHTPDGLAFDAAEDLYIADFANDRIQFVAASSCSSACPWGLSSTTADDIYTIAGGSIGLSGSSGDGGAATSARLHGPYGVALDGVGNLFIGDSTNNRIQFVAASSCSSSCPWGLSATTANDIYTVAGSATSSGSTGDGGAADDALFHDPEGIAFDAAGSLYVTDLSNMKIRRLDATASPAFPLTPSDIYTIGGSDSTGIGGDNGQATDSQFDIPKDQVIDATGDVYIADWDNNRVQEIAATNHTQWGISMTAGNVYTILGSAIGASGDSPNGTSASSSRLDLPGSVAIDASGDLYVADTLNDRIIELAATSHTQWGISMTADDIYTIVGTPGTSGDSSSGTAATFALLNVPQGVAIDPEGDLFISDSGNQRVIEVPASSCSSSCAWGLSAMTAGDLYTILGSSSGTYGVSGDGGPGTSALLQGPQGLAIESSGNLYVADASNNRIQFLTASSCSSSCPWGLSATTDGDVYTIAGSASGIHGSSGDGGAATAGLLYEPQGVALDSAGNLYIADQNNGRVQEVPADTGSQWNQAMTADDIYTVAGSSSGTNGYSGDGGPSSSALMSIVDAVNVDANGDLYIDDSGDESIREVVAPDAVIASSGPNLSKEVSGGSNPSEAVVGDPPSTPGGDSAGSGVSVDPMTGELDVNVTDDSIPGRGIPLELDRTYSSSDAGEIFSPFGYGWTDSYNMAVAQDPTDGSSVEDVVQEDGSVVRFVENAAGAYVAPSRVQATLVHNGGGTWTLTRDGTEIFTFNSSGELTSESDLDGYTTNLSYTTYDGAPVLSTVVDPANRKFTFSYEAVDGYALVSEITDPGSRTVQYGYDSSGDLTSVTDVGGGVTHYTYDAEHRLVSIENPLGGTTTETYNNANQVVSQTDPLGRPTTWSYGEDPTETGSTTITDPIGIVTQQTFTDGELTLETDAYGTASAATTRYGYYPNTAGIETVTDPDGHAWTYVYDANGNLVSETNPLGATTSYAYNALNEQVAKTSPLGETTTSTYDSKGDLLSTSQPLPSGSVATTSYGYGPTSSCPGASTYDLTSTTDALGNTTSYCYDSYGDEASVTDPSGNETTYTYNSLGEKTSLVSPRGNVTGGSPSSFTTDYSYDSYGNLTETTDPLGHSTYATYDDLGDRLTSTDQNGNETTYTYDADHELTGVAEPGGSCSGTVSLCTSYAYNADGEKTSMTDANGKTTDYGYSPLRELTSSTDPNNHDTTYTYDAVGNELTMTDPDGDETTFIYNAANELTSETEGYGTPASVTLFYAYDADGNKTSYADGADDTTTYTYDALDQLTSTTDPLSNVTAYTYDADGRTSTVTNPDGKVQTDTHYGTGELDEVSYSDGSTHSATYTYNPDDEVATMSDASGTSTYTYDDADRLTSYENGAGATVSYTYDAAGNVTALTYPNSSSVTYRYNALEEMTSVTDWNSNETQFGYDQDGDLTSVTFPNSISTVVTYDNADQLTSITDTDTSTSTTVASMSYTRDDDNLVTAESDTGLPAAPGSFSYNSLHELTAAASSSFTYNSAADLTTAPNGATQGFNADDETCFAGSGSGTCASPPSGATTYGYSNEGNRTATTPSSGTSSTYGYDEANDLTSVTPSSGGATSYVYDGNGLLQSETTGMSVTNYTWNVLGSVPLLMDDGTNYYIYGPTGTTPVEQINVSSGAPSYLLSDQLGSVRVITNSSGTVTGTFSYDAWGNLTGSTGSATTPFGIAGAYLDPSNGLYYLRARWYDAGTGQFMSLDPQVATTLQPYSYVGNNPVNARDPDGTCVPGLGFLCKAVHVAAHAADVTRHAAAHVVDNGVTEATSHWRGLAKIGIVTVTVVGGSACALATAGLCGAAAFSVGGIELSGGAIAAGVVVGAGAGAADYALDTESHSLTGYASAAARGAAEDAAISGAPEELVFGEWAQGAHSAQLSFGQALQDLPSFVLSIFK